MKITHICEVCDKQEELTSEEAYAAGWDYPPSIGSWGVISPRTCGNCSMQDTVWWKLIAEGVPASSLTPKQKKTLERIFNETASAR